MSVDAFMPPPFINMAHSASPKPEECRTSLPRGIFNAAAAELRIRGLSLLMRRSTAKIGAGQ